ncbi:MAG: GPR endopeptidase [Clostridia bacterium]|nr:GPR endopeptidase [Clostridia bacterium]
MREIRTDLAIERQAKIPGPVPGIETGERRYENCTVTRIRVTAPEGAKALGKPMGTYFTVRTDRFPDARVLCDDRLTAVKDALRSLLPKSGGVLVTGLGNPAITPDALGPKCAAMIFATRHIDEKTRRQLQMPALREVTAVAPGVTGQTGLEAQELIESVCRRVKPAAVVAVDALAAGSVTRLANTVQLSDAGIEPGAGVGNARRALNRETLGVPVIAVGVPTVVDALSVAADVTGTASGADPGSEYAGMMVTPRDIDTLIDNASRLLALAVNCALQDRLSPDELLGLM